MKINFKRVILAIISSILIFSLTGCTNNDIEKNDKFQVVTSFYPIQIIVKNLIQGTQDVETTNMTDTNVGCIHDYTLTTKDLKKLEGADLFIINGLGLENFTNKILQTYSGINIIDSSEDISEPILKIGEEINPHIWTSIDNYIKQIEKIRDELMRYNPENQRIYKENAQTYIAKWKQLKNTYKEKLQVLKDKKAICLNEAFAYLGEDVGLEITQISTNHEESTLSAEELKNIVEKMKNEDIKIILVGENDNIKNAQTITEETGAKIYTLKDGLTGDENEDSYYQMMLDNLDILASIQVN